MRYYLMGLIGVVALSFFGAFSANLSRLLAFRMIDLSRLALVICFIGYVAPRVVWAFQQHQAFSARLEKYAPNFVPRTMVWETLRLVVSWGGITVGSLIAILVPSLIFPVFVLALAFAVFQSVRRRFLWWAYKGGLPRIEQMLRILPGNAFLLIGKANYQIPINQLVEAANTYRELLTQRWNRSLYDVPVCLNNLGICLLYGGHYEEALPLLEGAVQISPNFYYIYDSLAIWYLEQELNAERAVDLSELALELSFPKDEHASPGEKATCSHALALTGRNTRADTLIEQALNSTEPLQASARAEIQRRVGYARRAQGNREAAIEHFQRAVELDPDGIYGKLSRRALDSL
jgi:tetratricopeptide (TPR) repeat protein